MTLVDRVAAVLERRTSRRGLLIRGAVFASALAVDPIDYLLHPGTAYAAVCRCGDPSCGCGSACCDGYTEFCCTLTGANACPPGTFAGGWWRADGSTFCSGPRYYIDCHGECPTQTGPGFCAGSDGLQCGCAMGDCANRQVGCVTFRYGQCHQEIATSGRIACRVVTCTPAYLVDNACTTTAMVDDETAEHNRPCLQAPGSVARAYAAAPFPAKAAQSPGGAGQLPGGAGQLPGGAGQLPGGAGQSPGGAGQLPAGAGLWLAGRDGQVFAFGAAPNLGSMAGRQLNAPVVAMAATPDGHGYWLTASDGGVFAFGSAPYLGSASEAVAGAAHPGATATKPGAASAPGVTSGTLAASGPVAAGSVASAGSVAVGGSGAVGGSVPVGGSVATPGGLVAPVVAMAATPDGRGYWQVASDGGVFAFGSAPFLGSMGGRQIQAPVVGMAPAPDGRGYWLVSFDGGVFAFGSAQYHGSTANIALNALIGGLVPTVTGRGYWLWGMDGSVYAFGDAPYHGAYPSLPAPSRTLPADGIDAFHALVAQPGSGYTLWAVSPLGPPPALKPYAFAGEPPTST